ncbi:hypothetical protein, partial [Rubrivirga sp.]|uniref:hypothetical protein n=1 Tax=Rubrivirga sp. TaxID=1885344 RepID=UPI003C78D4DE
MRLFLIAAGVALALPVGAQPVLTDSSGTYVVPAFGIGGSDGVDMLLLGLEAGTRLTPTVDVGAFVVGGDNRLGPGGAYLTFGPTAGYSTRIGLGLEVDVRGRVRATFEDFGSLSSQDVGLEAGFKLRTARAAVQATFSRPFKL